MMFKTVVFSSLLAFSYAIVCTEELCGSVVKQQVLNCKGSVVKKGGFCGCTDICASVEGERCHISSGILSFGVPTAKQVCDDGLECVNDAEGKTNMFFATFGICQQKESVEARAVDFNQFNHFTDGHTHEMTSCEKLRQLRMISFAIWKGQWTPVCLADGSYRPNQCDNTGLCFCVSVEGEVKEETKKLGAVQC